MSYILDALKKVENEKTRKATAGRNTGISGDLFQERAPRPSRDGAGKIVVVIVLVSVVTFAATWFVLKGDKKKVATTRSTVPTVVTTTTVQPSQPNPPAVAPTTPPPPQQTPALRIPVTTDSIPPPPIKSIVQTIPAPTDIKVSGIAWQDERAARRAVVNGFLLQEGTTVSGAKILEIHQDRVRFSSPAGIFDVRMDAATLSGAQK